MPSAALQIVADIDDRDEPVARRIAHPCTRVDYVIDQRQARLACDERFEARRIFTIDQSELGPVDRQFAARKTPFPAGLFKIHRNRSQQDIGIGESTRYILAETSFEAGHAEPAGCIRWPQRDVYRARGHDTGISEADRAGSEPNGRLPEMAFQIERWRSCRDPHPASIVLQDRAPTGRA